MSRQNSQRGRFGDRSTDTGIEFVSDLSKRLRNSVQITTDGHRAYLEAIKGVFGAEVAIPDRAKSAQIRGRLPYEFFSTVFLTVSPDIPQLNQWL